MQILIKKSWDHGRNLARGQIPATKASDVIPAIAEYLLILLECKEIKRRGPNADPIPDWE